MAQDIKREPTQEELNQVKEILRNFQKPQEEKATEALKSFLKPDQQKAEEFLQVDEDGPQNKTANAKLFYFFSFSMPEGSLKAVVSEAEKTGAVMVLRGMNEDIGLRATMLKASELLKRSSTGLPSFERRTGTTGFEEESYQVEVWIHPVLFRCFHVDAVPEIVYVTGEQDQEGCSQDYIKVRGNVSLDYGLGIIAKEDKGVEKYLKLLKEDFYHEKN
ncbi:MAG TPA: type-F conjugative transfer system pilin assembly protein TrbC [Thermodesulfobacteriota bacterium]|nr:type-F conjugative transfer system pilin assembly protein TrbC [Thermodesulfobacteriota bacterium]